MFEAYKVGVTLALHNQVSSVLGLVAREFVKTDAEAKKLQTTLKEIKLLGMTGAILGGAGFLGLGLIKGAVKPASEYVHQLELAKAAGMSQLEIAEATSAAWATTGKVMTTTATDNIKAIRELRMVFGDTADAVKFLPQMQTIQAVLDNVLHGTGGVGAKDVAFTAAKMLELRGASMNTDTFREQADLITKAVIASGGKVTPQMLMQAQKYAGVGGTSFNNDFMFGIMPTLVQELGGSSTGTSLTSMYRALVGGRMDKRSLAVWKKLGLADTSHADIGTDTAMLNPASIKGSALFKSNPFRYVQEVLLPALRAHGIVTQQDQSAAIDQLFSNRNAARIANILGTQGPRIMKDFDLISGAGSTSAYAQMMRNDPEMGYRALGSQWENLKVSLGKTLVPVLIPFLRGMTTALNSAATFAARHPTLTQGLMLTFTGLSMLATLGGGLMLASAGLKLAGLGLTTLTGLPLAAAAAGLGTLTAAIAGVVGVGVAVANADRIGASRWNPLNLISDGTEAATRWVMKKTAQSYGPPMRENSREIHTTVNIDGRKVAHAVNTHNMRDASRASGSGGAPDYRAIPRHPGQSRGW